MQRILLQIVILPGLLLASTVALAQRGVKVEGKVSVPASGETSTGSGPESPEKTSQGVRKPLYRVQRSDTLDISFTFAPELNQTVRVQPDGFIVLRQAGSVIAAGATVPELTATIQTAYAKTLHNAAVTVVLKDFEAPHFFAMGELSHPGKYELRGDTTLLQALSVAGGFTERAKHSQVLLFRDHGAGLVEARVINVKKMLRSRQLGEDLLLNPGDLLYVPQNAISKVSWLLPRSSLGMYMNGAQF